MTRTQSLLWVVTGSVSASFVPFHLNFLQHNHPDIDVRMVVTRSAEKFVSRISLLALSSDRVRVDDWDAEGPGHSPHVEWSRWADAVLVYPATFSLITRLAAGGADTPATLALQLTTAPIVLAPSLPPGGGTAPAYLDAVVCLQRRPDVLVLPTIAALSTETGRRDAHAPASFPAALDLAVGGAGPEKSDEWASRGISSYVSNANVQLTTRDLGDRFAVERRSTADSAESLPSLASLGTWTPRATTVRVPSKFRGAALTFTEGPAAASRWLISGIEMQIDCAVDALETAVGDLDGVLAELPSRMPEVLDRGLPLMLRRLDRHLGNDEFQNRPDPAQLADHCGPNWRDDLRELLDLSRGSSPCLGDFGLGTVFPVPGSARAELLCGDGVGVASAGHDRGMLLGEIAELRRSIPALRSHARLGVLAERLVAADDTVVLEGIVRTAALRMALHSFDFVAFEPSAGSVDLTDRWMHLGEVMSALRSGPLEAAHVLSRGVPTEST